MNNTPRSERIHITFFGCCNAGKSSLVNALCEKPVSIVSALAGTTTDPVSKSMELGKLGAVALTDTAGLDDSSELGVLRTSKAMASLASTDVAVLVTAGDRAPQEAEQSALHNLRTQAKLLLVAVSFADRPLHPEKKVWLDGLKPVLMAQVDSVSGRGIKEFRNLLADLEKNAGTAEPLGEEGPLHGLVKEGDTVILVTPIDSAAPKGRMILPEAATLRDALDRGCIVLTVRENQLAAALKQLLQPPKLVVTDSQAFAQVAAVLPPDQALTSFSILFARKKGDLSRYNPGLARLEECARGDIPGGPCTPADAVRPFRLLAIEACAHNRTHEDIATVKIPGLLGERLGRPVQLTVSRHIGESLPEGDFDLAVLCGGCMATGTSLSVLHRSLEKAEIPYLNFGLCLAWLNGLYPRAVECFTYMEPDWA